MTRSVTVMLAVLALAFSGMAGLPSCLLADVLLGTHVCPCLRAADQRQLTLDSGATPDAASCPHCAQRRASDDAPSVPASPAPPVHDGDSCMASHSLPLITPDAPTTSPAPDFSALLLVAPLPSLPVMECADSGGPTRLIERGPPDRPAAGDLTLPLLT